MAGKWQRFGSLAVLIVVVVLLALVDRDVIDPKNVANVLAQSTVLGVCAVGMTFVILTGGIDLAVGSVMALSGVVGALANTAMGLPWPLAWALGLGAGMMAGALSAALIAWGRMLPFIATLCVMAIARGITLLMTQGSPVSGLSPGFTHAGWASWGAVPITALIFLLLATVAWVVLAKTPLGPHVRAQGDNPEAARLAGLSAPGLTFAVYMTSGFCAGLAGLLMAGRLWSAQPAIGTGMELDAISAVVLGGTSLFGGVGSIGGTVTGTLIMGFLDNGLRLQGVASYVQISIKGAVFVGAVILDLAMKGHYSRRRSRDA
ncbi:MAG TPA: ABC transporter permease [Synergistaceae bacterium]|nr:ABC transporter permease [Synergistaceae bacterium]HQF90731.1 ABC transporter permease [Synergistaceae bacterium]HQH78188.1 ABC transporter permease [Synergistaceae bacterium]HQK24919.1 ABC transporter permease [Synergistaceae bacterium]